MNNESEAYVEGFVAQCAARGVDPEVLVKSAGGFLSGAGRIFRKGLDTVSGRTASRLDSAVGNATTRGYQLQLSRPVLPGSMSSGSLLDNLGGAGTDGLEEGVPGVNAAKWDEYNRTSNLNSQKTRLNVANTAKLRSMRDSAANARDLSRLGIAGGGLLGVQSLRQNKDQ